MKLAEQFNTIIMAAVRGGISPSGHEDGYKSFGFGEEGISFIGEKLAAYETSLKDLFEHDKSVRNSYTLKQFESAVIKFIYVNFPDKTLLDEKKSRSFFEELKAKPIEEYSVFREIHGIMLRNLEAPYPLGPFTIYHFPSHRRLIESKTGLSPELIWMTDTPNYLIETTTKARHPEKSEELADQLFEKFELCLRFAIGFNTARYEVGVLNYLGWRHRKAYVFSADGSATSSHRNHGAFESIPIDDKYFIDSRLGLDRMWDILKAPHPSELQKRLLLAIEWTGQAYNELSPPSGFLKAAIALEILFTQNEKVLINASILSQISESIALILGDSTAKRLEIEGELKRLYSMRSAIAHAGKNDVPQEDLFSIFRLCRTVIVTIMTRPALRDLKSISDIHAHLKAIKYSCTAI